MSLTIINSTRMASAEKRRIITATLTEVLATATAVEIIPVSTTRGILKDFHIVTTSTDFNISIRQKTGITPPSIDEIFNFSNADLEHSFSNNSLSFFNTDVPQTSNLYLEIDNTIGDDTGTISIKLVLLEG